jgi:hypothetical protein
MIKARVSLTLENEHGEVTENVYECEGKNIEEVETKLVTQISNPSLHRLRCKSGR